MGNRSNAKNEKIEVRQHELQGELICELYSSGSVSLVLLDEYGRTQLEKKWKARKNSNAINGLYREIYRFALPALMKGNYNVWIEAGDNTYLRQLKIYQSTDNAGERLKRLFRLKSY
ncbi:MAG: hypothetical protein AAGJ93_02640 [Bacteroidota bacterium]